MAEKLLEQSDQQIEVIVRSRSKTYFDGKAKAITSTNETGVFDVLPQHANFITMIQDFVTIVLPDNKEQKFEIKAGVMQVIQNKADIYLTV
jgi:F0F1-type ATP synthase epsilon subunit